MSINFEMVFWKQQLAFLYFCSDENSQISETVEKVRESQL